MSNREIRAISARLSCRAEAERLNPTDIGPLPVRREPTEDLELTQLKDFERKNCYLVTPDDVIYDIPGRDELFPHASPGKGKKAFESFCAVFSAAVCDGISDDLNEFRRWKKEDNDGSARGRKMRDFSGMEVWRFVLFFVESLMAHAFETMYDFFHYEGRRLGKIFVDGKEKLLPQHRFDLFMGCIKDGALNLKKKVYGAS